MGFSLNPNTGKPTFNDDIADPVGQFQAGADYAERVGQLVFATKVALDAYQYSSAGLIAEVTGEEAFYAYVSDARGWQRIWRRGSQPWAMAGGVVTNSPQPGGGIAGDTYYNLPMLVALPAGKFTVPPLIMHTVDSLNVRVAVNVQFVTATNFKMVFKGIGAYPSDQDRCHWSAVQMTPTAAAG